MDIVTIVVEGESAVYVLDELHPVLLAPGDNLLTLLIILAHLHLGLLGMQEHNEGDACAVGHLLQLIETGVKLLSALMDAHLGQHLLVWIQILLRLLEELADIARVDISAHHLHDGAAILLVGVALMYPHHGSEVHIVVGIVAAHQQKHPLGIEETIVAQVGGAVVWSPATRRHIEHLNACFGRENRGSQAVLLGLHAPIYNGVAQSQHMLLDGIHLLAPHAITVKVKIVAQPPSALLGHSHIFPFATRRIERHISKSPRCSQNNLQDHEEDQTAPP